MPQIEGRKEQDEALKRVKRNLTKVEDVNTFIKSVMELSKETADVEHEVKVSFNLGGEIKRLKTIVVVPDNNYIFEAAQKYKESIVAEIKKDSSEHHISLTPQESAMLEWEFIPETKHEN